MPVVASATLEVTPVLAGAQQSLTEQLTNEATPAGAAAGKAAGTSFGESMGKAGGALTKGVTVPLMAVGAASVAAWKDVDTGLDTIVQKTGASGDALESMQGILHSLTETIPTDFATAGAAIGEVNTRFGVTGKELEALSAQFIKFAELNGTDVSNSIDSVQAAMAAFGLGAEDAADVLDILNKAGQDTGVPMEQLASSLLANGTALQEMGFGFNTATGFLASLEKAGVDSSTMMTGLRKALQNATKEGKPLNEALAELQDNLVNAGSDTEAAQLAMELFGNKAGPAIANAVRDGRVSFDELANTVTGFGDSVSSTFDETLDPMDNFTTTLNQLKSAGAAIVDSAGPALVDILSSVADVVSDAADAWKSLSPEMQDTIIKVAGIAAVAGPLLSIGGKIVGGISTLTSGLSGLASNITSFGSSAASAAAPAAAAGASFATMAGQALQLIAAAAAVWIIAQAIQTLAGTAIELAAAGWPAIAVMGGLVVAVIGLMGAAAALGPAMTAGAVGIGVFGAAMVGIGAGIDLAAQGVATIIDAVGRLTETIAENADGINSVVSNVGTTFGGVVTTISDGITSVIDALSGGLSSVLDSVAGIFDSMGNAALNAGTGFEKLANAVINLVSNTGVLDLGATLTAVSKGVQDISKAASDAGSSATGLNTMTTGFKTLATASTDTSKTMTAFASTTVTSMGKVKSAFSIASSLASSMRSAMSSAYSEASSGISSLKNLFSNTSFSFHQSIAVPHFSMSGSFDAQTGSVPSVSTRWYARAAELGARFTTPQIIGVGDAAQAEILLGEEKLKELVGDGMTVTNYITVNGAEDPEAWATRFVRQMKLQARLA